MMSSGQAPRVPVIDFSGYSLDKENCMNEKLADDIVHAFSTVGFIYLKNHGIPNEQISETFAVGDEFFNLPDDKKAQYKRGKCSNNHGWLKIGGEKFDDRPADYKECYDVNPPQATRWPGPEVPDFEPITVAFYSSCRQLAHRILELMAKGLRLKDVNYFTSRHNPENFTLTALRYLHYPPIPADSDFSAGQMRCGEHTDYGSLTLLFQDQTGGLEVYDRELGYVPAPPMPGAIVVNLGDLMQRWTADRLVSTKHRVVLPPVTAARGRCRRRSVVCFVHPDADCMIQCIDGSNKYPDVTAQQYIEQRFADTLVQSSSSSSEED